jgi:peptidoglycan/xylan/chitin deacetylase (PgdA/CDA1 family)
VNEAVPVIMYHSVGRVLANWAWSDLTTPAAEFESQLRALATAGYRSATLHEFHEHVTGRSPLDGRRVVLTFDDGYLDNWSYAAPLLERYGFTGTVLVSVDFVPDEPALRPTLREVWQGKVAEGDLDVRAFMSWEELRRAAGTGTLDVQSHSMTHTWYPVSDEVVDFHHPGDSYYWLDWNAHPEAKPHYLKHLGESSVPYGVPVYRHEKSLACRRFLPGPEESARLAEWTAAQGAGFFAQPGWRDALHARLRELRRLHPAGGRLESDEERRARVEYEILESKRILSDRLGCSIDFFVWPGGGYDDVSLAVARNAYLATTVSKAERGAFRNRPGENPGKIVRRGTPLIEARGREVAAPGAYFVDFLEEFRGARGARLRRQVRKAFYLGAARAGLWPRSG